MSPEEMAWEENRGYLIDNLTVTGKFLQEEAPAIDLEGKLIIEGEGLDSKIEFPEAPMMPEAMDDDDEMKAFGKQAVGLINTFRAMEEKPKPDFEVDETVMPALHWSEELYSLCLEHAKNQADTKNMTHDGWEERFSRLEGYSNTGENVAMNCEPKEAMLQAV